MKELDRKRELRAFLMGRRGRLTPQDVGLPGTRRRRAPGLRREEVAALAGVSTAWYTAFEMAKDHRVSANTIDAIAKALRLSPIEVRHLYVLAGGHSHGNVRPSGNAADLRRFLYKYLLPGDDLGKRIICVAMNDAAVELFDASQKEGLTGNWVWRLFANAGSAVRSRLGRARALPRACSAYSYFEWGGDAAFDVPSVVCSRPVTFSNYWHRTTK